MDPSFPDHFSGHAADYARYRPSYPDELFSYLASLAPGTGFAWDCATGNGQAAAGLAPLFEVVLATDASSRQIEMALSIPRVRYGVCPAEKSGLPDAAVDLVTVAQALHWFDIPAFLAEARRVLVPGGVLAVWCYGLLSIAPEIDAVVNRFYMDVVGEYWPPERAMVERGYGSLDLPFEEVDAPRLAMEKEWALAELLGYVRTWSAVRGFMTARGEDPVPALERDLAPAWGPPGLARRAVWDLDLRVGRKR